MRRIRVVQVVEDMKVGGQECIIASLVRGLDRDRFDVRVWCTLAGGQVADELRQEGYPLEVLGLAGLRRPWDLVQMVRRLKRDDIDVVHTHAWGGGLIGRAAAWLAGTPVIVGHAHGIYNYIWRIHLWLDSILCRLSTTTICCSEAAREFMLAQGGAPANKVTVVYNGIDFSDFAPRSEADKQAARRELGFGPKDVIVGAVGGLYGHKGHEHLVRAFPLVLEACPDARLLIIGGGPRRGQLEQLVQDLGLTGRALLTGVRRDVPRLLSIMDVFALPSHNEAFGLAALEAMASRVPVVASRIGGVVELVKHRETGLLVEPRSPQALAEAIVELLATPDLGRDMAERAYAICRREFSIETMVDRVAGLYVTSLEQARTRATK